MIRVLFVESYPHVFFGQQRTMLSLLDACLASGIAPVVAVTGEGPFTNEVRRRHIDPVLFPYPKAISSYGGAIYRVRGLRWIYMMLQVVGYVFRIRAVLSGCRPQVVFCNDMRGLLTVGLAARTLGIPVMIWDKLDKPHGWMDLVQLPLATRNLIISDAVLVKYPLWQRRYYRDRIQRVYNGADIDRFYRAPLIRSSLPGEETDIYLAIVGTITSRKGQDRILSMWPNLMERVPSLRLLIIGETAGVEDDAYLAKLPNRHHPRVHFLGMRQDVPSIMRSIDILLVPSRHEGMGQVTVEAMACSLPVIGSSAGGIGEVVLDGETGLIVDMDDPKAVVEAVFALAVSPELRKRMGDAGYQRVKQHFNRSLQMQKVLTLLTEMV